MTSKADWRVIEDPAGEDDSLFFTEEEHKILEAVTARIIPTDEDPGAREARVIRFIDRYLSGTSYIYAAADGSGFLQIEGREEEAWQRRVAAMQERYRDGVQAVSASSEKRFGRPFVDLTEEEQDEVLVELSGWPKPAAVDIRPMEEGHNEERGVGGAPPSNQPIPDDELEFFPMLVLHTRQGFYSDPAYGGNADHVGWQVVGFPGPESLAESRSGSYSTIDYMLPDEVWPFTDGDKS